MTASPLEARCSVTPLEALSRLIAVAKTVDGRSFDDNADWHAFESELGVAEMVLRDAALVAIPQDIHCQEFHELAMDYRSAGSVFDAHGPQKAYERLCAYALAAVLAERSACAAIADSVNNHDNPMTARDVADAIRARI